MWRNWLDDSEEDIFKAVNTYAVRSENFFLHKYIRDPEDAKQCFDMVIEHFGVIKIYQKHL